MIAFISRFTERQSKPKPLYLSKYVKANRPSLLALAGEIAADMGAVSACASERASRVESKWQALKALNGEPGITVRRYR